MLDLKQVKKVYFIGIGGIMMSALAKYFLAEGKEVNGSDRTRSEITKQLIKLGARINFEQVKENIKPEIDLVVYTKAVPPEQAERLAAQKLGLPAYAVYEVLGQLSKDKKTIAVAGMHGKSTTSSLMGLVAEAAGLDPTVFVGTQVKAWDGNLRIGKSQYLISEACEYKDSFLNYHPYMAIITNIEAEHLDYFKNLEGVMKSFQQFTSQVKKDGWLVINADNQNAKQVGDKFTGNLISFAVEEVEAELRAEQIELKEKTEFRLSCPKFREYDGQKIVLQVPGLFNVYNALAVIASSAVLGIKIDIVKKVLAEFKGIWRRFELAKEAGGVLYYDDYAHHPTEIKATLEAVEQKFKDKNFWLIFQPHLYSRTQDFMEQFAKVLGRVENLIVAPIYPAREENKWGVSSQQLVDLINSKYSRSRPAVFIGSNYYDDVKSGYQQIKDYLKQHVQAGDVVMTMGAGDVDMILR